MSRAVILLGLDDAAKDTEVSRYCAEHAIEKVVILSPARFRFACSFAPHEQVEWAEIQLYAFFYRLMREIDARTLIVVNECLRTQNRHDLNYNCLRNYLAKTQHQLVFQYLPIIDTWDDFAVLFDLDTSSRWKREKVTPELVRRETRVRCDAAAPEFVGIAVCVDAKTTAAYAKEREKLFAEIRGDVDKDPHQIPRNLLLVSGKAKLGHVDPSRRYVGRNNRYKLGNLETYREVAGAGARVVFELPHAFLDMADLLTVSRQRRVEVLVADTKAEHWYLDRFIAWAARVREAFEVVGAS